jgi:hypothetical protein
MANHIPDINDALNVALEVMTQEAEALASNTRLINLMPKHYIPRTAKLDDARRQEILAAIESIKIFKLKRARRINVTD